MIYYFVTGLIFSPDIRNDYREMIMTEYESIPIAVGLEYKGEDIYEKTFDATIIIDHNYKFDKSIKDIEQYVILLNEYYDKELSQRGWIKKERYLNKKLKYDTTIYTKGDLELITIPDGRDNSFVISISPQWEKTKIS